MQSGVVIWVVVLSLCTMGLRTDAQTFSSDWAARTNDGVYEYTRLTTTTGTNTINFPSATSCDILMVAGGGSGSHDHGGGGGAGAVVYVSGVVLSGSYTAVVGIGGVTATAETQAIAGRTGGSTTFVSADGSLNFVAQGGGAGAGMLRTQAPMEAVVVAATVILGLMVLLLCAPLLPRDRPSRSMLD